MNIFKLLASLGDKGCKNVYKTQGPVLLCIS